VTDVCLLDWRDDGRGRDSGELPFGAPNIYAAAWLLLPLFGARHSTHPHRMSGRSMASKGTANRVIGP
jgi:hypothetical protein